MKFVLLIFVLVILVYYNYCCVESFYAPGKETKSDSTKSASTKSASTKSASSTEDLSKSAETLIKNHLDNLNSKDDFNDKIKLENLISNIKKNANKILGLNLENSLEDLLN